MSWDSEIKGLSDFQTSSDIIFKRSSLTDWENSLQSRTYALDSLASYSRCIIDYKSGMPL